jgi:hypothetical protein
MALSPTNTYRNPWLALWNKFSSIGGALGLCSVFRDIVEWKTFFADLINAWAYFTRPVSELLFGWLFALLYMPFPDVIKDYLLLSLIIASGLVRHTSFLPSTMRDISKSKFKIILIIYNALYVIGQILLCMIIWPLVLFAMTSVVFSIRNKKEELVHPRRLANQRQLYAIAMDTLYHTLSPVVFFLCLIIANYVVFVAA